MQIELNHFVKRQTARSRYSHFEPPHSGSSVGVWSELASLIDEHFADKTLVTNVTPDGLILKLSLPEDACQGFFSGVILADKQTVFKTSFGARERAEAGEMPFIQSSATRGRKARACCVDVILYHRSKLSEEELTYTDAAGQKVVQQGEWQVVSINARDTVAPEPPTPMAMARNMARALELQPEGIGGTARLYTAEQFMESILYWSIRTMSEGS